MFNKYNDLNLVQIIQSAKTPNNIPIVSALIVFIDFCNKIFKIIWSIVLIAFNKYNFTFY